MDYKHGRSSVGHVERKGALDGESVTSDNRASITMRESRLSDYSSQAFLNGSETKIRVKTRPKERYLSDSRNALASTITETGTPPDGTTKTGETKTKHNRNERQDENTSSSDSESSEMEVKDVEKAYILEKKAKDAKAKKENRAKRTFAFNINTIRIKFLNKYNYGGIFLEFEVGGLRREVSSATEVEEKTIKKKHETKDGKGHQEEFEAKITEPKKMIEIIRRPAKKYYTRIVQIANLTRDTDEPVTFRNHAVTGEWTGSYDQLEEDTLTLRIYQARTLMANVLIGEGSIRLVDVAKGKVDQEMIVFRRTEIEEARKEAVCQAYYKFELEELFDFKLKFQDWEMQLSRGLEPLTCEECCAFGNGNYYTRPSMAVAISVVNSHLCCYFIPYQAFPSFIPCIPRRQSTHLWMYHHANKWGSRLEGRSTVAEVSFYGTRSALENDRLDISIIKGHYCGSFCARMDLFFLCHGPILGENTYSLQGKLDYGYIVDPKFHLINKSASTIACIFSPIITAWDFCAARCTPKQHAIYHHSGLVKGVIRSEEEPRYRQLGNVGRPSGANKFLRFQIGKRDLYLAVKIVRAKGLISLTEYKESLCPSVTVDWAQTRRETRIHRDDPEPFFDEWVYFRVPRDAKNENKIPEALVDFGPFGAGSKVLINVWDNAAFSKLPLGFCEIDFNTIYEQRKQMLVESATTLGVHISRYVFCQKFKLKVPKLKQGELPRNFPLQRSIEIMAYFDMGSRRVGPPKRDFTFGPHLKKKEQGKGHETDTKEEDIPNKRLQGISEKHFKQARDYWVQALAHVPEASDRCFAFCGIDEYSGELHYLPSFITRIIPPAQIQQPSDVLNFVHSIEVVNRRNGKVYEKAKATMEKLGGYGDLKIWSDPWNFLDKRRGDHNDHAVLLANFLLGNMFNAYVCIGRVRVKGRGAQLEQRRGRKNKHKKLNKDDRKAIPERSEPHVWVMTLEDEDKNQNPPFFRTVRFWEPSNGRTYVRMNPPRGKNDKISIGRHKYPIKEIQDEDLLQKNLDLAKDGDSDGDSDYNDNCDYAVEESKVKSRIRYEREKVRFLHQLQKGLSVDRDTKAYEEYFEQWSQITNKNWEDKMNPPEYIHPEEDSTPYTSIDVVFNNHTLYANLQARHPHKIQYDLCNPDRWVSFRGEKDQSGIDSGGGEQYFWRKGTRKCTQFYPDKTMISAKSTREDSAAKENELQDVLKGSIQAFRTFEMMETEFYDRFEFQAHLVGDNHDASHYIRKRLRKELDLGNRCGSLVRMERKAKQESAETNLGIFREIWQNEIIEALPENRVFSEMVFHFKHANTSKISDVIITKIADSLLRKPDKLKPKYAVGVKIKRLPGMISPLAIMISCSHLKEIYH